MRLIENVKSRQQEPLTQSETESVFVTSNNVYSEVLSIISRGIRKVEFKELLTLSSCWSCCTDFPKKTREQKTGFLLFTAANGLTCNNN